MYKIRYILSLKMILKTKFLIKYLFVIIFILLNIGCTNKTTTKQFSIDFTILQFKKMKKLELPPHLHLENNENILKFASKKLQFQKERLKLIHYKNYIIIHFEDKKYEEKYPDWKYKKFGEALVIDKNTKLYTFFRFSRT